MIKKESLNVVNSKIFYLIPLLFSAGLIYILSLKVGEDFLYNHDHFLLVSLQDVGKKGFHAWSSESLGSPSMQNAVLEWFSYIIYLFLFRVGLNIKIIELIFIFLTYTMTWYFSWLGFYRLGKNLCKNNSSKKIVGVSLLVSFFYTFNLYFTIILHTGLGIFDNFFLFYSFLPLLFYTLHKYLQSSELIRNKSLLLYALLSFFCFSAIPWFYCFLLFVVFLLIINFVSKNTLSYRNILRKVMILGVVSFLINFVFIVPLAYEYLDSSKLNSINKNYSSSQSGGLLSQMRFFNWWTFTAEWNGRFFHSFYPFYNRNLVVISLFVFYIIIIKNSLFNIENKERYSYILIFFSLFLLFIFLAKGSQPPLGEVFNWLFNYFPLFSLLRNPDNKLGSILVFTLSMIILFTLMRSTRLTNIIVVFFIIFFLVYDIPLFTGRALLETNQGEMYDNLISVSEDYNDIHKLLNYRKLDFSTLNIPGIRTSSYIIDSESKEGHSGQDLLRRVVNKPLIYLRSLSSNSADSYRTIKEVQQNIEVTKILNVKYIILRWDIPESVRKKDPDSHNVDLLKVSNKLKSEKKYEQIVSKDSNVLDIYKINSSYFLPHIYVPKKLIATSQNIDTLPEIVSQEGYDVRSAVYFNQQENIIEEVSNTPTIEFKKISPTKYRAIVHHADGNFSIVFNESFHNGWKIYLSDYKTKSLNFVETDYKILDFNEEDQATIEELNKFIGYSHISSIGDLEEKSIKHTRWENNKEDFYYEEKYKIDFISKNIQDTIQNDNLENGTFYETWFKDSIDTNSNHTLVNGYANSWDIKTEVLCFDNTRCVKNEDGSYDLELVIDFWPQRLFYLGLSVSGIFLFSYLGYFWFFNKNLKLRK
ncbi:hypothetical protein ACFLZ4_01300 [Patescibacteria group bacterium]